MARGHKKEGPGIPQQNMLSCRLSLTALNVDGDHGQEQE